MAPSKREASPQSASDPDAEPPTSIDPYETLGLEPEATQDDIKRAYRKQALKHHPDKASPAEVDTAKVAFQRIAFAYAVLSDPRRRRRYDATGSTAESLLDEDGEDFDWLDFYRNAYVDAVTPDKIRDLAASYKNGPEERADLLAAYVRYEGDLDKIFESVMLCEVLADESRFREMLDAAIAAEEIPALDAYTQEPAERRARRTKKAKAEAAAAEKEAAKLASKAGGKGKKPKAGGEDELLMLIQSRQASRDAGGFLANLEAKYGPKSGGKAKGKGGGRKRAEPMDEPPEEAFAATAARAKRTRGGAT